ncbi:hypothetical protein C0989_001998 [Termitomyces sp. Mn162]|nr:hypothetical protein C0989_001998 [Termitomyces sp. Mn162]
MLMVQMIADAYEERRRVWEFHKDRPRQKGDNPAMYGPINEAQKNVEDFLVKWRFLSGPSILHKEASMVDKPVMRSVVGSAKELTILPSFEYRRHRTKNSLKPSVSMKVRYVLDNLHFRKMPQERSIPKQPMRKVVSVLPARRIFTALPRIDPGYKVKQFKQMSLRRMTRADSCALRACSVRKRKFTPAAEYEPTAEFLAELHPLPRRFILTRESCIQHDELKTLSWIQARRRDLEPSITSIGKTNVTSVHDGKSHTSPFISLVIYLLIQFTILVFCVIEEEQKEELDEEEAAERVTKYARRQLGTNADRYVEPEPELGSDGEPIVEPEVDISAFLEKQRIADIGPSIAPADSTDDEDVDTSLAHIGSKSRVVTSTKKGKMEKIEWDEALDTMSREKASAEAAWGTVVFLPP